MNGGDGGGETGHPETCGELRAARDEAERRSAELEHRLRERTEELAARDRELQEFSYMASHDLQEPLRKIRAFGSRLADRLGDSLAPEDRDSMARMIGAAERMNGLIESLLAYSRVTTVTDSFAPVDLGQVVEEARTGLARLLRETDGRVEWGALPTVEADKAQMRQLFQHLIANGLTFRRPEAAPVVTIRSAGIEAGPVAAGRSSGTMDPGEYHRIVVEDNGVGFEARHQERIFQPFQRLHGRSEYPGAGMGLAICRKIAERHHGAITAASTPGQGSRFIVYLPATRPNK